MAHTYQRHAISLLPLLVVLLAPSGMVLSQDPLFIPVQPETDGVVQAGGIQEGAPVDESLLIESLDQVPQEQLPPAELPPIAPQAENELPPFNADEMADEDRDDLLRGPVHEAFAEQVNSDPTPNMIVTLQPPEPVEELPPELKPNGREVEWISGYWAWDEDQDDFIWISGVWREIPQGFRWLPGYWTEVEGGYQWVSGTWVSTQTTEIQYVADAPPETLELGPVGVAPASDHIWIPGTWMWSNTQYAWRPGYWSTGYENWVWVPARHQWTPRGYYFCNGYWDYPVNRRGVLFAPSYFNRRFRANRITRFTPRVVVSTNLLTTHFWVRPRYRHYYFGNYYNVAYVNRGLVPWHQYPQRRHSFDPLFAYYSRGQRANVYQNQLSVQFNLFVNQPNRRPPITFRDQDRWQRDGLRDGIRDIRSNDLLGNRFQNLVDNSNRDRSGLQFVRLENRQREQVQQETRQLRDLGNQRRDVERSVAQLQRHHDGNPGQRPDGHDGNRIDLRDRSDRNIDSRGSNDTDSRSDNLGRAGGGSRDNDRGPDGGRGPDGNRGPGNRDDDTRDSRVPNAGRDLSDRDGGNRDGIGRDGNSRDGRDGDATGRGPVADTLRLDPKVDSTKDGGLRQRIENTAQDDAKKKADISNRIDQKAPAGRQPTDSNGQNVGSRRIERDGTPDRLKLPPTTRSIEARTPDGVSNPGRTPGVNNAEKTPNQRPESRTRPGSTGPANNPAQNGLRNSLNNTPNIRNGAEIRSGGESRNGAETRNGGENRSRTPGAGAPTENSPGIRREFTPRSAPATRPAPSIRSTPADKSTPSLRSTPEVRSTPAPRTGPPQRTTPAPRLDAGRANQNQSGIGSTRSAPSVSPPRGDTGSRVRSNAAPAPNPGRNIGAGGGAPGRSGAAAPGRSGPGPGAGAPGRSGPGPGAAAPGRSGPGAGGGAAGKRGRGK